MSIIFLALLKNALPAAWNPWLKPCVYKGHEMCKMNEILRKKWDKITPLEDVTLLHIFLLQCFDSNPLNQQHVADFQPLFSSVGKIQWRNDSIVLAFGNAQLISVVMLLNLTDCDEWQYNLQSRQWNNATGPCRFFFLSRQDYLNQSGGGLLI